MTAYNYRENLVNYTELGPNDVLCRLGLGIYIYMYFFIQVHTYIIYIIGNLRKHDSMRHDST